MYVLREASSLLGGKAHALARAARHGLPVPDWFVVSPGTASDNHSEAGRAQAWAEIAAAIRVLAPNGEPVAVRSSAMQEDGASHAFAGQFDSFLPVAHVDVPDRIVRVWQSAASDRVHEYCRRHGLTMPAIPAVLVQRMVRADASGVAFTADPVTGARDVTIIAAIRGLAPALVSGAADGDTVRVDRQGRVVERSGSAGAIDDRQAADVAGLARRAEDIFGSPQDIEWAFESGRLFLLQSRPITSRPAPDDGQGRLRIWDNSNIIESYGGVTTPMTFSFARDAYEGVYRQFCRVMRVPRAAIDAHEDLFANMLGFVRGRVYYNLLNWYRLLTLLPGYGVNRRFMEQMMGVREPLAADAGRAMSAAARARDGLRLAGMVSGLAINFLTLTRRQAAFRARLARALAPSDPPLPSRTLEDLAAYYRQLRRDLLTRWDAPILNDFFAMVFYGALRDLAARWCGDVDGTLQNDLLAGEGGLISTEPARRIETLAALARKDDRLVERLLTGTAAEIDDAIGSVSGFPEGCRAYLEAFGERCTDELKLESPTLIDDPLPLFRAIGQRARQLPHRWAPEPPTHRTPEPDASSIREQAERRAFDAIGRRPMRRLIFGWVLASARAAVRDRENLRFERTRVFGRVRRIFVEIGRRLHEAGALAGERDVFYLQVEEVMGFVEGRAMTGDLKPLVALRRAEFAQYTSEPAPPARFETRGPVYLSGLLRTADPLPVPEDTAVERRGVGCCPGVRRGPVRVVHDPSAAALEPGTIVVAERTDPGWILVFPSAAGLIVERGSLLSHSAIVARELGMPAIVSMAGATTWLKDGDWVEMDGRTGLVRKVAA